jgi:hypothetical protein
MMQNQAVQEHTKETVRVCMLRQRGAYARRCGAQVRRMVLRRYKGKQRL